MVYGICLEIKNIYHYPTAAKNWHQNTKIMICWRLSYWYLAAFNVICYLNYFYKAFIPPSILPSKWKWQIMNNNLSEGFSPFQYNGCDMWHWHTHSLIKPGCTWTFSTAELRGIAQLFFSTNTEYYVHHCC